MEASLIVHEMLSNKINANLRFYSDAPKLLFFHAYKKSAALRQRFMIKRKI